MADAVSRRGFLKVGSGLGVAALAAPAVQAQEAAAPKMYQGGLSPWPLCLNTSTIRPSTLDVKIDAAAEAGFDALELWINELEDHEKAGGNLKELGAKIKERGLYVINVIGLWSALPPTQEAWDAGLPETRERMRRMSDVGSRHAAAIPPSDVENFDLKWGAARYKDLLKIGREEYNIIPAVEFVGFFKSVYRLGQAVAMAIDSDEAGAMIIPDTFHLYRGGSGFEGIRHINGKLIAVFHFNDVGPETPREQLADEHRIYPGDGILPLQPMLRNLRDINYTGPLSLELFNREHWKQDPKEVARTGLQKMKDTIATALKEA
ncbi:MAG: sugar phosphate isomerase/epimerase [FCB group bacterium]|nr:sugar phosphate isomerase/epimerase [FCB group bacterium]